jgi:ribosomal protein S20
MKKLIAAATTAGLLIVGTAGVAQAADSPKPDQTAHPALRQARRAEVAKVAAAAIGIEPKALIEAVRGGQSVADVAKSHNVEPQAVVDAIVAAADKKIDRLVDAGTITAERAATMKDRLPDRVTKLVNGELKGKLGQHAKRAAVRRHARRAGAVVAAGVIGIQPKALAEAVRGGQSVADVATSHNVDPQAVIDAVVAAGDKKIDSLVDAGRITAERAATMKDRLPERVSRLVNATPGARAAAGS